MYRAKDEMPFTSLVPISSSRLSNALDAPVYTKGPWNEWNLYLSVKKYAGMKNKKKSDSTRFLE
jgi:hypothetical protein